MMRLSLVGYGLICLLFVGLVACGAPPGGGGTVGDAKLTLDLSNVSKQASPGKATTLEVMLKDNTGEAVDGATVTLRATMGSESPVEATLAGQGGGRYVGENLAFGKAGSWKLLFQAKKDGVETEDSATLVVDCKGDGSVGSSCCNAGDCTSGACEAGVCAEAKASCTDGKKNGAETDVDCGGSCGGCGFGKVCAANTDCAKNACEAGKCVLPPEGLLGLGDGSKGSVSFSVVTASGLNKPADLAFHPQRPNELWIVSTKSDSIAVVFDPGKPDQKQKNYFDRSQHFMEEVQGIAFGTQNTFGTCGDTRNTYGGLQPPNNFMGPVWWSSDLSLLDRYAADISRSHLDMLHSSPYCMGIAATGNSTYFVFNGHLGTLDWYDFKQPHVPGGTDHKDGIKYRYADVSILRVPGVPSNLVYDAKSKWLYIADSGNGRIIRVSVESASQSKQLNSFFEDGLLYEYRGAKIEVIVPKGTGGLQTPSGLALHKGVLFVSDHATGKFHAFDLEGKPRNTLESGLGAGVVGGLTVGPDSRVYFTDMKNNRVLRIDI